MPLYSSDVVIDNQVEISNFPATQPVTGTVDVGNFPATQPVSGSVSVSNFPAVQPVSGTVTIQTAQSNTATITQITTTGSNQTILAANANRKSAIIFVAASGTFLKYGAVASNASFTYSVTANSTTIIVTGWAGQIDAIGPSNKLITVTELV